MERESKIFNGVDRANADRLRGALSTYVQLPPGDSGTMESQGVKGSYAYDEAAQTLTLSLEEVPFFIPRAMIWGMIEKALQ